MFIIINTSSTKKSDKEKEKLREKHLTDFNSVSMNKLKILSDFLKPFKAATDELEATKTPTLCLVVPWYHTLLRHMQPDVTDPILVASMKRIGHMYWKTTVKHLITEYHDDAVFLHPEMKSLKLHTKEEKNLVWERTLELMDNFEPNAKANPIERQYTANCGTCEKIKCDATFHR